METTISKKELIDWISKLEDKKILEDAVKEAKSSIEDEAADKDKLDAAMKELNEKIMPIGAKLYEAAAKADEEDTNSEKKDDEPVEGEIIDDDKDKKSKKKKK